jgi:hypothetical protein
MEEMPHDDVASCCLAEPWHYASGKDLGELPWADGGDDMHSMPWSRLTWDEKDRLLPPVAVADDHLYDDDSIEAPAEHPMDRIRNGGVWRMGHKQAG